MKLKYFFTTLLALAMSITAIAQSNPGVDYLSLGEYELAKSYFMRVMRQAPQDAYYYLGQIELEQGNVAEAKASFQKGLNSNPESVLNNIGMYKLELKTDEKDAKKELHNIRKKNKKDIHILLEVARAFSENDMTSDMEECLKDAMKADKKSPYIYIFQGHIKEMAGDTGGAATQYDHAINFDPSCTLAYIKGAKVYQVTNPPFAIEKLEKAIELDPTNPIAQKFLANLSFRNGFYADAIKSYSKLIESGNYTIDDLRDYAAAQYFSDDHLGAIKTILEGLKVEPQNFVLNRLLMYAKSDLKQYEEGLEVGKNFFDIPRDTAKYLDRDHLTYAKILGETGYLQEAIDEYNKALEIDPSNKKLYKEIAQTCASEGLYEQAGDYYVAYNKAMGEEADDADYFLAGRYYYIAGDAARRDSLRANEMPAILDKASNEFDVFIEKQPDNYMGYLWKGRAKSLLDPTLTQGFAKPYYEKAAELIAADEEKIADRESELMESYVYLAFRNYIESEETKVAADKAAAKKDAAKYCKLVLDMNPEHEQMKQIYDVVK